MADFVAAPAPTSAAFSKDEHLGRLLVIEIFGIQKEDGDYGPQDVIVGAVHVLDGPQAGHTYEDQTIYGTRLVGQARATLNAGATQVVGRLARGQARKGQPPWILDAPTDADLAVAQAWSTARNPAPAVAPQATAVPPAATAQSAAPGQVAPIAAAPTPQNQPPF